jgi:hypothetical protein
MKSQNEDRKSTRDEAKPRKIRFQIEKLEERIAPARGGVHGPPGREPCDLPRAFC